MTFAVPRPADLEFHGDDEQLAVFARTVGGLETMGWRRLEIELTPFREVAALLYDGPWIAERLAGLRVFLADHAAELHPITRDLIEGGKKYSAADLFDAGGRLDALRPACLAVFDRADVLVVPTMPVHAHSGRGSRRLERLGQPVGALHQLRQLTAPCRRGRPRRVHVARLAGRHHPDRAGRE